MPRESDVYDALSEDRTNELERALEAKKYECSDDERPVWAYICKQTTHEPSVIRFT